MNKDRLLALADYMETVDKSQYNQNAWLNDIDGSNVTVVDIPERPDKYLGKLVIPEGFCGSSACVLGHAAFCPALKDTGIFVGVDKDDAKRTEFCADDICVVDDEGEVLTDYDTAYHIFGIPHEHAHIMFGGASHRNSHFYSGRPNTTSSDVTPKLVAKALRKYVETDGKSLDRIIKKYA